MIDGVEGTHRESVQRFGYQPALDGVRALAVMAVLGFHLGLRWLSGGYLGVSVFFTLSGFLITSLLLREHHGTGRIDLPAFYQRRARRLIPAGLLVLALVCIAGALHLFEMRSTFRRDVLASMFQVLNWVQLFGHQSYADLFSSPSPVTHYWSLGVEEQFYVLWPVAFVLLLRFLQRRAIVERLLLSLVGLWVLSAVAAPLTARWWSHDAAYYATWARASEVMSGAVLAAVLVRRRPASWWAYLAPLALALMAVLVVVTPSGHGWAFAGGLPLFGLVSATLVAGLQTPGLASRALSVRPLVWVGRLSYGIYLFHWPVFVVLDEARTGWHGWQLATLRLAVTFAAATASYHLLEHPIRLRRVLPSARRLTSGLAAGVVVVGSLAFTADVPLSASPVDIPTVISGATSTAPDATLPNSVRPSESTAPTGGADSTLDAGAVDPVTSVPAARVLALLGDSVPAWLVRDGAAGFTRTDAVIVNGAREGCDAMIDMPMARDKFGHEAPQPKGCEAWDTWYPKVLDQMGPDNGHHPDIAVLMVGQAPVLDHLVDGRWVAPCQSVDWYLRDVAQRIEWLRSRGLTVVFVFPARLGVHSQFAVPPDYDARMKCVRAALIPFVERTGVATVDMDPELCPANDCEAVRSRDGVHIDPDKAPAVLNWLVGEVLAAARP
jgi:peptidoglycan/LPS O-acetylase OafA/YrhL